MKIRTFPSLALSALAVVVLPSQALAAVTVTSELSSGDIDLTASGTLDWMKLGDGNNTGVVVQKAGANHIGPVVGAPVGFSENDFAGSPWTSSWTDGDAPTTGSAVNGSLEAKSPALDDAALVSLTFDVIGLVAGSYRMEVYGTAWRSDYTFTSSLSGGDSDSVSDSAAGSNGQRQFTIDFTLGAGEVLTVNYAQTSDNHGSVHDNIGIAAITLTSVPEPSSVVLVSLGLMGLLSRRRR